MNERKRLFLLILIMTSVSLLVAAMTMYVLYQTAFEEERERLVETAQSQARLIEAVARFDAAQESRRPGFPGGAAAATLSQIVDAHKHYEGSGATGEFTLARREGDDIVFLLSHRHYDLDTPRPVEFDSDLAEPMRRALSGLSGTVIGRDYRGAMVLAAHEPVANLNLGIVAKIDLAEIREPFIKAGLFAIAAALAVVMLGTGLFLRVSEPLVKRLGERAAELTEANARLTKEIEVRKQAEEGLQESEERHRNMFKNNQSVMLLIDPETSDIVDANPAACSYYGYSKEDLSRKRISDIDAHLDTTVLESSSARPDLREPGNTTHRLANGELRDVEVYSSTFVVHGKQLSYAIIHDITARRNAESELQRELSVSAALSDLYKPLISPFSSIEKIAKTVLDRSKSLTGSKHGYVSSIDPVTGDNVSHTLTEMLQGQCGISDEEDRRIVFPRDSDGHYPGLWGHSLNQQEAFYTNSPKTHPASNGAPEGHVPIERFMSLPVMLGEELVGQISLANSDVDYTELHLDATRRLGEFYALAIQRRRAEEKLRKAHEELEKRVQERTAELSKINEFLKQEICERERAEEKNRKQSEFLRSILESITHPFYVIDADDYRIRMANSATNVDLGSGDLVCYSVIHQRDMPCTGGDDLCPLNVVKKTKRPVTFEHVHPDKDGKPTTTEVHGYPIFDQKGNVAQMIEYTLDITKRKRAEEQILASLKEKEVLLREIHHRVKNNLQVVSSLLHLQSCQIKDRQAVKVFEESKNRIRSMALIHEKMYQSEDLAEIDFAQYIKELADGLFASFGIDQENISLRVDVEVDSPGIEVAICCGLIVNELVSNSLKHAFPAGRQGEIVVGFHASDDKEVVLTVRDNGIGMPADLDFKNTESLGLQLVNALSDQLDGKVRLIEEGGTTFSVAFGIEKK